MSTVNNGLDMLLELQALAAKNKSNNASRTSKSTANTDNSQTKSFAEIWNNIQKKQAEWDQLMDNLDIAQYKLALSDSFWSSQADSTKHLRNYTLRHQKQITQKNLADVTSAIAHLRQLNTTLNGNVDPEMTKAVEKKLQSALNDIIASTIKSF